MGVAWGMWKGGENNQQQGKEKLQKGESLKVPCRSREGHHAAYSSYW